MMQFSRWDDKIVCRFWNAVNWIFSWSISPWITCDFEAVSSSMTRNYFTRFTTNYYLLLIFKYSDFQDRNPSQFQRQISTLFDSIWRQQWSKWTLDSFLIKFYSNNFLNDVVVSSKTFKLQFNFIWVTLDIYSWNSIYIPGQSLHLFHDSWNMHLIQQNPINENEFNIEKNSQYFKSWFYSSIISKFTCRQFLKLKIHSNLEKQPEIETNKQE